MTREELVEQLKELVATQGEDREAEHIEMDTALLAYINDSEITELYKALDKWYA